MVYSKSMTGLKESAVATVMICTVFFLAAWEAQGEAGRKYREVVKKAMYLVTSILPVVAGVICGLAARIGAAFDPRPAQSGKGLKSYRYRRGYSGRHHSGNPVWKVLQESKENHLALAS